MSRAWLMPGRSGLLAVAIGGASAFALPPFHLTPLLLLALPLLLNGLDRARGAWAAARLGWFFGFGHHLVGLYWITDAILFDAAHYWWLVPLATPALAAVLAWFIAAATCAAWFAAPGWRRVLTLAGAWTAADLARQFILSGFPWNPLGSVWGYTGLPGDIMLAPAALVSIHGLTLATILAGSVAYMARFARAACLGLLAAWFCFGVSRIALGPEPDQAMTAILVQGNTRQGQKYNAAFLNAVLDRHLSLTHEAETDQPRGPTVAIWPETAYPYALSGDHVARAAIAAATLGRPSLIGAVRDAGHEDYRNSLFALDGDGGIAAVYDKTHLVPFGEYQPSWFPLDINVLPGVGFTKGDGLHTIAADGIPAFGPLICYEAIFPGQVVSPAARPQFLVNVTNDGWFGTSTGPYQHLSAARTRAIEEGLPLVRAANTGVTAAFDAHGHESARIEMNRAGFRIVPVPKPLPPTVFAQGGLWIPGGLALCCIVVGLARRRFSSGAAGQPTYPAP